MGLLERWGHGSRIITMARWNEAQKTNWFHEFWWVARKTPAAPVGSKQEIAVPDRMEVRGGSADRDRRGLDPDENLVEEALRRVCRGMDPRTPEAMADSPAQRFAVIPSSRHPRCLIPAENPRCVLNALTMVHPRAWRSRMLQALLSGVVKTGWRGWARESVLVGRGPLRPLESIVEALTGEKRPVFAILIGRRGLYRKLIIQVMSPSGKILCYVKLSFTEASKARLQHEATTLQKLEGHPALSGQIPKVLYSQEWPGGWLQVQSAGSGKSGSARFTRGHEQFLRHLWEVTQTQKAGQNLVDEVGRRWQAIVPLLTQEQNRFGELALRQAGQYLSGVAVRCGLMHGDFAPSNTFVKADGELFVCDWEFAEFDQPNLWDALNFHADAVMFQRKPQLAMDWVRLGSGDLPTAKGLLRLYLLNSICLLMKSGLTGPERVIACRHEWLAEAVASKVL